MRAAERSQDEFRVIVAGLVGSGTPGTMAPCCSPGAHGIAGMEVSGYLAADKWHTTADEVVDTLVRMVAGAAETT